MRIRVPGHSNQDYSKNSQEELDKYFIHMCAIQNLEKIKYILESPEFNGIGRPNPHTENDHGFKLLIRRKNTEIIDYLIFEYKIEKTQKIDELINAMDHSYLEEIKNKFMLRETNSELNKVLPVNDNKIKKPKV